MFSFTVATIRLITALRSALVSPHRPRNDENGDSVRTPGPPQTAVLTRSPSKSRKTVCTVFFFAVDRAGPVGLEQDVVVADARQRWRRCTSPASSAT